MQECVFFLPKCCAVLADVTDSASLVSAAQKIGRCDILINTAGYTRSIQPIKLQELTDDIFDEIINTNLRGTFSTIRAFHPFMSDGVYYKHFVDCWSKSKY